MTEIVFLQKAMSMDISVSLPIFLIIYLFLSVMSSIYNGYIDMSRWNKYLLGTCKHWFLDIIIRWINMLTFCVLSAIPGCLILFLLNISLELKIPVLSVFSLLFSFIGLLLIIVLLVCHIFRLEINEVTRYTIKVKTDAAGFVWRTHVPESYGPEIFLRYSFIVGGGIVIACLSSWMTFLIIAPYSILFSYFIVMIYITRGFYNTEGYGQKFYDDFFFKGFIGKILNIKSK